MASIFSYDPNPPRVASPWLTPKSSTPPATEQSGRLRHGLPQSFSQTVIPSQSLCEDIGITKLEAEPQEGSTEYKLHLLLRPRRKFYSTTTGIAISGSYHSKPFLPNVSPSLEPLSAVRVAYAPSSHARQTRLQQLTTQLLWRLQQSSPFHSSSTVNLVLPVLPEATPKLVPSRPAELLPGLEESQGALYEIGVSDDGTLVGLIEEELEESLTNLKAMAASLGCVVELMRKVAVGDCEWREVNKDGSEGKLHAEKLWVAEALVRPNLDNNRASDAEQSTSGRASQQELPKLDLSAGEEESVQSEQLRIALTGCTTSGKSSLLGTLTTSTLDNGRGKSRLSLLRHRHEIASGVTSSVAQELLGYRRDESSHTTEGVAHVINYASGDVSSWNDIHHLAERLIFFSDSPGLVRYAKSTLRALVSWDPHWTVVCVAADGEQDRTEGSGLFPASNETLGPPAIDTISGVLEPQVDQSLVQLELCLRLDLPIIVAITKFDLATKPGLRQILSKILSTLKGAGRKPVILATASLPPTIGTTDGSSVVPDLQCTNTSDEDELEGIISKHGLTCDVVPIVLTSSVTGAGIPKMHALLRSLPFPQHSNESIQDLALLPRKLFRVDEVFTIPPSKVYSTSSELRNNDQGVVLCGHMAGSTIAVGDSLVLGPFLPEALVVGGVREEKMRRSSSYAAHHGRSLSAEQATTPAAVVQTVGSGTNNIEDSNLFVEVRVVSLRNLRLPVSSLLPDQVGTIGVESTGTTDCHWPLTRARKGMVLISSQPRPAAYRTFTGSFSSSDFIAAQSPSLLLGGQATVYINSIRAAARVTAVSLANHHSPGEPSSPMNVFDFESDEEEDTSDLGAIDADKQIAITFRFVSSIEWMEVGDKVFVIPATVTTGPVAGTVHTATGLSGFVGRVQEVIE